MGILRLEGKEASYLFDPSNPETLLRENGKFGNVYAGARESDKTPVVIKHLNPELLSHPMSLLQFRFEADMVLDHPVLRNTLEYAHTGKDHFLIQEYVKGWELKVFLMQYEKYRTVSFVLQCMLRILDALEYLHGKDVVHCDIKPSNILVEEPPKGEKVDRQHPPVRLIDLGNARTPLAQFMTTVRPFSFIYSPPEQVLHHYSLVCPASDLSALAITTYELITGKNAFGTYHPEKLMHMQVAGNLLPNPDIPEPLFRILAKASARISLPRPPNQMNREEHFKLAQDGIAMRYQSADELKSAFREFLESHPAKKGVFARLFG